MWSKARYFQLVHPNERAPMPGPNVIVILADDLGYSDIGCFGGEIATPNIDRLASEGVRLNAFYNTARCSPSRASLLTGRHPHEIGVGILNDDDRPWGYPGSMSLDHRTMAEYFKEHGYSTYLSGKWHLSADTATPNETWPTRRGFDGFYGILAGANSYFAPKGLYRNEELLPTPSDPDYYFTDAVTDHAVDFIRGNAADDEPFFLYLAYTAPHWPLQAPEEDVERYLETFAPGWDVLREQRLERLVAAGVLPAGTTLSQRDPTQPAWDDAPDQEWEARRMAVYAAQVERMDVGIGRVLDALASAGAADDTLVMFLSDNGPSAESLPPRDAPLFSKRQPDRARDGRPVRVGNRPEITPGAEDTYASYGRAWANLSNVPFRLYKRWVHEGGIATPLLARWPRGGLAVSSLVDTPFQLTDILPTVLEAAGIDTAAQPGISMLGELRGVETVTGHTLFWEHMGNCAVRLGDNKVVKTPETGWELYDLASDRGEEHDLAVVYPEVVDELVAAWEAWAAGAGVIPWETYGPPK